MPETLRGVHHDRLERSCSARRDSIRFGPGGHGIERAEVFLSTYRFEPHRHDSYAIGLTTAGVQTFRYRGTKRVSLPGDVVVLHPDELHDGVAGTEDGFAYRVLYVAPELVRAALGADALPFVAEPVQEATGRARRLGSVVAEVDEPVGELGRTDLVAIVADALRMLAGGPEPRPGRIDVTAVELARAYLSAHAAERTPAAQLERITGVDRYALARDFRRAFGTSPDRYRTLRRLELARAAIGDELPLAQAAAHAGFADQSHMTRHFKRTYGMTPGRWAALTTGGG